MQKRLLLFDIDGTLIHSGGAGVEALKRALTERFQRNELKIAARLLFAQAMLRAAPKTPPNQR